MALSFLICGLLGFFIGLKFKLKVLLALLVAILFGSLVAIVWEDSFSSAMLTIFGNQAACQFGYFVGALIRHLALENWRTRLSL